ncbi:MAG: DUF935 family protein [Acidobacteriota bacterium]|nr:DUF935 family protein [Acidobacteriota bacterium]
MEQDALFAPPAAAAPKTAPAPAPRPKLKAPKTPPPAGPSSPIRKADASGIRAGVEIATIQRGEFLAPITIWEFPNLSPILRHRAEGQGVSFYDLMLGADADMNGFFRDIHDNVLHLPMYVRAASSRPEHQEHKRLIEYAIKSVPNFQNFARHVLQAQPYGFSITEKIYKVVDRGDWTGAVVYDALLDKPARWFTFDPDRNLRFRTIENYLPGELVPQEKFAVATYGTNSSPWGTPVLDDCYWPWFLRHHALKNQAIWFEKWASPTVKIEYDYNPGNDELSAKNRAEALVVGNAIQQDTVVAYPKGAVLGLFESARSGSISFEQYLDQLRNMLSRIITGQILLGTGDKGGSYAMARVHQEQENNRVESTAKFLSHVLSRMFRELIDRNYGPQDAYPVIEIFATGLAEQQAFLEVESLKIANGHLVSRAWSDAQLQNVLPDGDADVMQPPAGVQPSQPIPVPQAFEEVRDDDPPEIAAGKEFRNRSKRIRANIARFASKRDAERETVLLASADALRGAHAHAKAKAGTIRAHLDKVAADSAGKARPAIRGVVKTIAARVRTKAKAKTVTKAHIFRGLKGTDGHNLGRVFDTMTQQAAATGGGYGILAAGEQDLSDAAKIALALQMYAIADAVAKEAAGAPDDMSGEDFANSLLDENATSGSVTEVYANLFEGTHSTNIATIATGKLRDQLADPAFRAANPYVVIVAQADARLGHKMMDGYVLSAEEARWSPFLPPHEFGCRCVAVPISEAKAVELGLTGASPAGTVDEFLAGKGVTPSRYGGGDYHAPDGTTFTAGPVRGFMPAFPATDMRAQLSALREKAQQLQRDDPESWAAMHKWLLALFGFDILIEDPKEEDPNAN